VTAAVSNGAGRLLFALLLLGCEADIPEGRFLCEVGRDAQCPAGFVCCPDAPLDGFDGRCRATCEDGGVGMDAGAGDAGVVDGGPRDAGPGDGGAEDGGPEDAGPADAGAPDLRPLALAAGAAHSCLVRADGAVFCWGDDRSGQLGRGTPMGRSTVPVQVAGVAPGAVEVAASAAATCVRHASGVQCWGSNTVPWAAVDGPLGDSRFSESAEPIDARISAPASRIAMGAYHACAVIAAGGAVECWGDNRNGQLGTGDTRSHGDPAEVVGLTGVTDLCAGDEHTCAIADGRVYCWGRDGDGQVGDGAASGAERPLPTEVPGLMDARAVACGAYHTCAVADAGGGRSLHCWGNNRGGQVGRPPDMTPIEAPVASLDARAGQVEAIALGGRFSFPKEGFTCARGASLPLHCFGDNNLGQLGIGGTSPPEGETWQRTLELADSLVAVAAGGAHACAIEAGDGGRVLCWGVGSDGQLGNANTARQETPVEVFGFGAE